MSLRRTINGSTNAAVGVMHDPMSAKYLVGLLQARHCGEVFVPECKLGSVGSRVMDAFALAPTWSPVTATGYEIKVSRSDWKSDQKFHEYLPCCHLFCVVAPKGLVKTGELPDGVGLLEPVGQGAGTRLIMRVKPVRHEVDPMKFARVLTYVLLWRVPSIDGTHQIAHFAASQNMWREFVEGRAQSRAIGRSVGPRLREELQKADERVRVAESRAKNLDEAAAALAELGITDAAGVWSIRNEVQRRVLQLRSAGVVDSLSRASASITAALSAFEEPGQ